MTEYYCGICLRRYDTKQEAVRCECLKLTQPDVQVVSRDSSGVKESDKGVFKVLQGEGSYKQEDTF